MSSRCSGSRRAGSLPMSSGRAEWRLAACWRTGIMFARQNQGRAVARNLATMGRGLPRVLRSVSPAAVAVTVSLLIGGAGFADAATGGTFLLGKANQETSTAFLSDAKGT